MYKKNIIIALFSLMLVCAISTIKTYAEEENNYQNDYINGEYVGEYEGDISNPYTPQLFNMEDIPEIKKEDLKDSIDLSSSGYFPSIGSQIGGSCVAWASTYYQFTYEVNKFNNRKLTGNYLIDKSYIYSPEYIHNYYNLGDLSQGSNRPAVFNLLSKIGAVSYAEIGDSVETSYSLDTTTLINALSNKISDYKNIVIDSDSTRACFETINVTK